MQEAMEADQEGFPSTSRASLFTEDSSLLSDYLHHQAQTAGNRLLHHRKPLILLHSKSLLTASAPREEDEVSNPSWLSSSANSIHGGSSAAQKESSESIIVREGSSHALSELDQDRGDSAFLYRTTLSSFSCVESSECEEINAEGKAKMDVSRDSLCSSRLKEVSEWADERTVGNGDVGVSAENMVVCDALDHRVPMAGFNQRVSTDNMNAFDLLIHAAMQVEFLGDENDQSYDASHRHAKRIDGAGYADPGKSGDSFPVSLSCPILKKKVVRRARSAFSKQAGTDLLQRLGISSPAQVSKELVYGNVEEDDNGIKTTKADHIQQWSKAIPYTRRKSFKRSSKSVVACKTDVSDMMQEEGEKGSSKQEDLRVPRSKACNMYLKEVQVRERQCKIQMKQKKLQVLPTPELPGPVSKPVADEVKSENCEGLHEVRSAGRCSVAKEKFDCIGREGDSEVKAEYVAPWANFGGSVIRLKIRPMGLPSKILPQVNKSEDLEADNNTITRRSERLRIGEHATVTRLTMQSTELIPSDSTDSLDTEAKDGDPLVRSKRGRSQVLPTKFSDSVLQPWKKAYRKK